MDIEQVLPWHERQYQDFIQLAAGGRLGHAWLVSGVAGIGKLQFVRSAARYLLCQQPAGGRPCERCNSCHLFSKETHPDWFLLQPPKRLIVVDQIREAIEFAITTSQRGGYKILCIDPAEAMNSSAANALLKLLEEPPSGTLLFLLSRQPGLLLATLRSRCQHLKLPAPARQDAVAWLGAHGCTGDAEQLLQRAGGAPLLALAMGETAVLSEYKSVVQCVQEILSGGGPVIQIARKCERLSTTAVVETLLQICSDLVMYLQADVPLADTQLRAFAEVAARKGQSQVAVLLHALHMSLLRTRRTLLGSNNPNALLVLEQVFGEWYTLRRRMTQIPAPNPPTP